MSLTTSGASPQTTKQNELKQLLLKKTLASGFQISKETLNYLIRQTNPEGELQELISNTPKTNPFLTAPFKPPTYSISPTSPVPKNTVLKTEIVANYIHAPPIENIKDISKYFTMRFNQYQKYLKNRLTNLHSLASAKKLNNEKVSVIGIVFEKRKTHNNNFIIEIEDLSGTISAIITKKELFAQTEEIIFDEVLGIIGTATKGAIFVDEIVQPDLPIKRDLKTSSNEVYAAFLSDVHIGSKKFLSSKFENMLSFTAGKSKSAFSWEEQSEIINNLKYIFVAGDVVDGIGIYPGQEKEINIKDIYAQYKETAKLFAKIPEEIQIIMCPGNHDYVRLAQPQPPIEKDTAPDLYDIPNLTLISSPGVVKIRPDSKTRLTTLLYHGTSIDTIVPQNPNLKDGYKHPEKVMLALLKKRHLSPQYESGIVPADYPSDPMAIPEDIDIIHTGHVHSNGALNYRGVTMINSGTWQDITEFQKFLGHEPTPARTPVLNLKTRQIRLLEF